MAISALGSASGLDLESLVKQLVQVERQAKDAKLTSARKSLDSSLSGFGKLKSSISKLQDAVKALSVENLSARTATVKQPEDNKTFVTATAKTTATPGNFDIKVNAIAEGSRVESNDNLFAGANSVVSTTAGKLTFEAGGKSFSVDVTANMTLDQLRRKINAESKNFGVSANLINAGGTAGTKLVLTSNVTGAGNDLKITNNNAELDKLSTVATGTDPVGVQVKKSATDASIQIDGIVATSKTNTFTNVIQDVELTVSNVTPAGDNAQLTVATDKKATEDKIKAFMDAYNGLVSEVGDLTKNRMLSSDGKTVLIEGGALNSDPMVRSVMSQITSQVTGAVKTADPKLNTLYALGITFNDQGKMEISTRGLYGADSGRERLDKALDENYDAIAQLFSNVDGLGTKLEKLSTQFTQRGGLLAGKEESIKSQIKKNDKDREAFEIAMFSFETTMRQRYGALDTQLGQMNRTSSYLTAQLASLPKYS